MRARTSSRAWAREPARSYGARRKKLGSAREKAVKAADGSDRNLPPHRRSVLSVIIFPSRPPCSVAFGSESRPNETIFHCGRRVMLRDLERKRIYRHGFAENFSCF